MTVPSDFDIVVSRLKESLGLTSDTAVADALGMRQSSFANRKKTRSLPFELVIRLAEERDIDLRWLFAGVGASQSSEEAEGGARVVKDPATGYSYGLHPTEVAAMERRKTQSRFSEFELIERKGVLGSAGPGAENVVIEPKGALAFRRDWLRTKGAMPAHLIVVDIVGDSMEPTLFHGDTTVFNSLNTTIASDAIYLFSLDARLYVKRLRYKPGSVIEVISDNRERYPPFELTEKEAAAQNFEVKGVFFWRGGDRLQ